MGNEGARINSKAKVICSYPDVCLKQIGNSVVPIPYPVTANFGDSVSLSDRVRFGGDPAFLLDQSTITKVIGDSSGDRKGIKSGTIEDEVKPKEGSKKFRVSGKSVVRHGDKCDMNSGNTQGKVVFTSGSPACKVDANGKPTVDTNPPIPRSKKFEMTIWIGGSVGHIIIGGGVYNVTITDTETGKSTLYTMKMVGIGVGLSSFRGSSRAVNFFADAGKKSDSFDGYGYIGGASAEVGIGVKVGGGIKIPNGPFIPNSTIDWDRGGFDIGVSHNVTYWSH